MADLRFTLVPNHGDARGASYAPLPEWAAFLGTARDMHITTVMPGQTRANHYHVRRKEVLVVLFEDRWLLKWDNGPDTAPREQIFEGAGTVMVEVERLAAHALLNLGETPLRVIGLCDGVYDLKAPDTVPKQLLP